MCHIPWRQKGVFCIKYAAPRDLCDSYKRILCGSNTAEVEGIDSIMVLPSQKPMATKAHVMACSSADPHPLLFAEDEGFDYK